MYFLSLDMITFHPLIQGQYYFAKGGLSTCIPVGQAGFDNRRRLSIVLFFFTIILGRFDPIKPWWFISFKPQSLHFVFVVILLTRTILFLLELL